jgi:hypothetical protein
MKQNILKLKGDYTGLICLDCGWIGISFSRHDFKRCNCDNRASIDGGKDYIKCGAKDLNRIQTLDIKVK